MKSAIGNRQSAMFEGIVVSFNNNTGKGAGYGFIRRNEGPDIFVHINDIEGAKEHGRAALFPGDRVSFELGVGKKGPVAKSVRVTLRAAAPQPRHVTD
jgi:CspA family cold shock protein